MWNISNDSVLHNEIVMIKKRNGTIENKKCLLMLGDT